MKYVYILRSVSNPKETYTGKSHDLRQRLKDHNDGKSIHTRKYKPWKVIFYCAFESEELAVSFEKYLKSSSGKAFRNKRLIEVF